MNTKSINDGWVFSIVFLEQPGDIWQGKPIFTCPGYTIGPREVLQKAIDAGKITKLGTYLAIETKPGENPISRVVPFVVECVSTPQYRIV